MKKGQSAPIIIFIIILIVGIGGFIIYNNSRSSITGNVVADNPQENAVTNQKNCKEIQVPYEDTETYTDNEPYTDKECENINLKAIYEWGQINSVCENEICDQTQSVCAEENFWGNCIKFEEKCIHKACTKYRMHCNLNIENIDDESGNWKIQGMSSNRNTDATANIKSVDVFVQARRSAIASWDFLYDAGENMGCSYNLIEVPTKQVCDNVIKNKDVTKTRKVIKYKVETKC